MRFISTLITRVSLVVFCFLLFDSLQAQDDCWLGADPILDVSESYGVSGQDRFESIINTSDGGYLAVGTTYSPEVADFPGVMWFVKLDAMEEVVWMSFYEGAVSSTTEAYDVVEGSDGYVIVGNIVNGGQYNGYVVKIDYDGNIIWTQELGTANSDDLLEAVTYSNGRYVAVGRANNSGSGWVVVLEENGVVFDDFIYSDLIFGTYEFYGVEATGDGGVIIAGSASAPTLGVTGGIAIKLNDDGFGTYELGWEVGINNLPSNAASRFWDVAVTPDGEYVFSGNNFLNTFQDVLVVKLDENGNELWQQILGDEVDELARGITVNDCGQIIVAASTNSVLGGDVTANYGGYDAWVLKLSPNGDVIWEKNFGGSGADLSREVVVNNDGVAILAGITNSNDIDLSNNFGVNDGWIWAVSDEVYTCNSPDETIFTNWIQPTSQFDLSFCEEETINATSYVADFGTDECASQDYFLTTTSYDVLAHNENGVFNTADFAAGDYLLWAVNSFVGGLAPDTLTNISYFSTSYCSCGDADQLFITIEECVPECEDCEASAGTLNLEEDIDYSFCLEDDLSVLSTNYTNNECFSQYLILATDVSLGGMIVELTSGDSTTFDLSNYAEGTYSVLSLNISNDIDTSNFDFVDQIMAHPFFGCLIDLSNPVLFSLNDCIIDDCLLVNTIPEIEWSTPVGGENGDYAYNTIQTSDGGYLVVGDSYSIGGDVSNPIGMSDWWVVKLDAAGQLVWEQSYGTVEEEAAWDVIEVDNGHFVIAGNRGITNNAWAMRIDGAGNVIWANEYGGSQFDEFRTVEKTADGGFAFFGGTNSADGDAIGNTGGASYWLVKTDGGGNIIWQNTYGSSASEGGLDMKVTPDGGYVMTGQSYGGGGDVSGNYGQIDAWIVKVDTNGNIEWENNFGGSAYDYLYKIDNTPDGGYIAAGNTFSNDFDVVGANYADWWVVKLDINGNIEWINTYGGSSFEDCKAVLSGQDGYYLGGTNGSADGEASQYLGIQDYWVMKLDFCGEIVWEKSYGGSYSEEINNMQFANDGGLILSGYSDSNDGDVNAPIGFIGYWIAKLEPEEGICEAYTDWIVEVETPLVYCPDEPILLQDYIEFNEDDCYTQIFAVQSATDSMAGFFLDEDGSFAAGLLQPGTYTGYGLNVHEDELPVLDASLYWSEDVPCTCFDLVEVPIVILESGVPPCGDELCNLNSIDDCEAYTNWNTSIAPTTLIELCPNESLFLAGYVESFNDTECYAQTYLFAEAAAPNNILTFNDNGTFNANDYPSGSYIAYALNFHIYTSNIDIIPVNIEELISTPDFCYDLEQVFVNILTADDPACFEDPCALTTCDALVEGLNIVDGTNYCTDEIINVTAANFNNTDCYNQTYLISTQTIGDPIVLQSVDGVFNTADLADGSYTIWGLNTHVYTDITPINSLMQLEMMADACYDLEGVDINVGTTEVALNTANLSVCSDVGELTLNDYVQSGEGTWSDGTNIITTIDPSMAANNLEIYYTANSALCNDTDTLTINITDFAAVQLTQSSLLLCDNNEIINLVDYVQSGEGTWSDGTNNLVNFDPSTALAETILYYSSGIGDCADTDTLTINILESAEVSLLQNSLNICNADDPVNLNDLVSEGEEGQWTTASGDIIASVDPANLIVDNPTEFYYTALGDCVDTDTLIITTTNFIEVGLTENTLNICSNNETIILSEYVANGSGIWTLDGASIEVFNPASSNTETVELIYGNTLSSCADSDTLSINIESDNQVSLLQSSLDICSNDDLIILNQLVSDGFGTWSDGTNEITNFDPSTAAIDELQELYFSSGTGECDDTDTLSIIVTAGAEVSLLESTLNFCNTDEAIDLNDFVTEENGEWSDGTNIIYSFDPATAIAGTEIELFYTGGEAECADTDTLTITVNTFEEVEISETNWSICNNDTPLNLSDFEISDNGQWSNGTDIITTIDPSTAPINTLIQLYYSSSANVLDECKDVDTLVLTVYEYVEVDLSLSSLSLCTNDDIIELQELVMNANGTWTNEEGNIVNSFNPGLINENTISEFYYTANTSNCADVDTLIVETIVSQEVALTTTATEICIDEAPLQLNDFVQNGDGLWIDQFNQTVTSINPTDYGVNNIIQTYYASGNGLCDDVDTLFISIIDVVEVELTESDVTFCKNDPIVLLDEYVYSGDGQWTDEAGFIVGQFNPEILDSTSPTEFYFSAFSNTCVDVDTLSVTINERPDMPIFGQSDYAFCSSDDEILMSAEGANVLWYDMSNLSDVPTPGNLFQPTESGVYYVTQTVNGCTSMPAAISVLIEDFQEVAVNGFSGPLCAGDTIALNSLLVNTPNDGYWTGEGVEDNQLITTGINAGVYNLSYTIPANVCDDFSDEFEWELLAPLSLKNDAPQIECKDLAYQVNFTIYGGLAPYTVNGDPIAGNSYTSEWRFRLDYEYIIEDANGCAYYLGGRTPCPEVFLRPNPNNGNFWVSYGEQLTDEEEVIVKGYDSTGRELANEWITYTNSDNHFTLEGLPAGIYLFVFQFENESITKKVLIF